MRVVRVGAWLVAALWCAVAMAQPSFPALSGRVVDTANLLDAATRTSISNTLEVHEAETTNQIVVVTVPTLEGYDIADYGVQLARHWGIGTKESNNGVVILVAPNERKVRIEVGYGLEGALPDGLAGDIIRRQILPEFRTSNFSAGIAQGVSAVLQAIDGEYDYDPAAQSDNASSYLKAAVPIVFIGLMFISTLANRRFNNRRVSQAVVPAGFVGMVVLVISENPFIALALGLGVFVLVYLTAKHSGNAQGRTPTSGTAGGMHTGLGSSHGGFSGGGGSFGGGGASGGW